MAKKRSKQPAQGFTLIEVTVAIIILASALTILIGMQSSLMSQTLRARNEQQAMLLARRLLASFEVVDPELSPGTQELSAAEALKLEEVSSKRDEADFKGYENFTVRLQVSYLGIPNIDPQAMKQLLVDVMWSEDPGDSLQIVYFTPNEKSK